MWGQTRLNRLVVKGWHLRLVSHELGLEECVNSILFAYKCDLLLRGVRCKGLTRTCILLTIMIVREDHLFNARTQSLLILFDRLNHIWLLNVRWKAF